MKNRIVVAVTVLAAIGLGAGIILHKRRAIAALQPADTSPVPVTTASVRDGAVAPTLDTVALIVAERSSTVAAQAAGAILEVRQREGDRVAAGQVLARIDPRVLDDAVESARARLAAAAEDLAKQEAIFQRDGTLRASHDISEQAFEVSKAQLEASRAAEKTARRMLASALTARSYADVTAPYASVVTARLVDAGDLASPGKPLFTLQVVGSVRLLSKVSQDALATLRPGGDVVLTHGKEQLRAQVTRIYPALDSSRLAVVETELPEPPFGLPAGATLAATYAAAPSVGLVVPAAALLQGLSETLVVRVRAGRTEAVPVVVTTRSEAEASVRGELAAGDVLVVGPPSELMALSSGVLVVAAR